MTHTGPQCFDQLAQLAATLLRIEVIAAANRRCVLEYLDADSIPPGVFELVAGADPDQASKTMRRVLGDPHFDWRLDGGRLLREHKPSHFERPPLPSVLALSREMIAGLRFLNESSL